MSAPKQTEIVTVNSTKAAIARMLEDLRGQGIIVLGITVEWRSIVPSEDVAAPTAKLECDVFLEATL